MQACVSPRSRSASSRSTGPAKKTSSSASPTSTATPAVALPAPPSLKLKKKGKTSRRRRSSSRSTSRRRRPASGKNVLQVQCVPNPARTASRRPATSCARRPRARRVCRSRCVSRPASIGYRPNGSDLDTGFTGRSRTTSRSSQGSHAQVLPDATATAPATRRATRPATPASGLAQRRDASARRCRCSPPACPVCVINRYQPGPITGTFNLSTGAAAVATRAR